MCWHTSPLSDALGHLESTGSNSSMLSSTSNVNGRSFNDASMMSNFLFSNLCKNLNQNDEGGFGKKKNKKRFSSFGLSPRRRRFFVFEVATVLEDSRTILE
jgi:hypothetical protein